MCPGPPKSWVACKELTTALGQVWGHLTSGLDLGGLLPVHLCLLPSCLVDQACSPRPNPLPGEVGVGTAADQGHSQLASDAHFLQRVEFLAGLWLLLEVSGLLRTVSSSVKRG